MSSTRHAAPGAPLSQNRFASSYQRGLLANLVAKRCKGLTEDQSKTIWFLQWLSWQPGGIAAHVEAIFPKKNFDIQDSIEEMEEELCVGCLGYGNEADLGYCRSPHLDPDLKAAEVYRQFWIASRPKQVVTVIGDKIADSIRYATKNRCLALIDGAARIGKTFAARDCCEASAGMMRYCQVPSSNDDQTFFRAIAKSLGIASSNQLKAQELRIKVEDTLQTGQIGILFDEAHYLFDSFLRSTSLPRRVNWLLTALVNYRVPVVLVTTPQFYVAQKRVEKSTGWTSEQFIGRIGHTERLPDSLPKSDLLAVARNIFPEGDSQSWNALANYSLNSKKYLAAIDHLCTRARWIADKAGRKNATANDLRAAILESVSPVENTAVKRVSPHRRGLAADSAPIHRDAGAKLISGRSNESIPLVTG